MTTTRLLTFDLGEELYAIDLACVRAVLAIEDIQRIPDTPSFLMGIIDSPFGPVPLVDFALKFRLASADESARSQTAVVVEALVDGAPALMGVAVKGSSRVVEIFPEEVAPAPELSSGIRAEFLQGVVTTEDTVVPLIDLGLALSATEAEAIEGLRREIQRRAVEEDTTGTAPARAPGATAAKDVVLDAHQSEYLLFTVSGEKAALPLTQLRELVQYHPPTPVPGAARWISGVVNVRGEVIPVLDVAYALGLAPLSPTPRSCSLIVEIPSDEARTPAALAVDGVLDVIAQSAEEGTDGASLGLRVPAELVQGIARAGDEYVPVLDPAALLAGRSTRDADSATAR